MKVESALVFKVKVIYLCTNKYVICMARSLRRFHFKNHGDVTID
jgi:hypothetical protein